MALIIGRAVRIRQEPSRRRRSPWEYPGLCLAGYNPGDAIHRRPGQCCAICRLRHDELPEAAHILPDGRPLSEPIIPNGPALYKLHHAALDSYLIGVTPNLEVTVRIDVLQEIDGPTLLHRMLPCALTRNRLAA